MDTRSVVLFLVLACAIRVGRAGEDEPSVADLEARAASDRAAAEKAFANADEMSVMVATNRNVDR